MDTMKKPTLSVYFSSGKNGVVGSVDISDMSITNHAVEFCESIGLTAINDPKGLAVSSFINWYIRYVEIPVSPAAKESVIPTIKFEFEYDGNGLTYIMGDDQTSENFKLKYLKWVGYDSPEDLRDKLTNTYLRRGVVATRMGKEWSGTSEDLNYRYTESMYFELPEFWKELSVRYNYTFDFDNYLQSVFQLGRRIDAMEQRRAKLQLNSGTLSIVWLIIIILTFFGIGLMLGRIGI